MASSEEEEAVAPTRPTLPASFARGALRVVVPNTASDVGTGLTPKMRTASIGARAGAKGNGAAVAAATAACGMRSALNLSSPRSSYRGLRPSPTHHASSRRRLNPAAPSQGTNGAPGTEGGGGGGDNDDAHLQSAQLQRKGPLDEECGFEHRAAAAAASSSSSAAPSGSAACISAFHDKRDAPGLAVMLNSAVFSSSRDDGALAVTPRDAVPEAPEAAAVGGARRTGVAARQQALRFRADTAELPFAREIAEVGGGGARPATCPPVFADGGPGGGDDGARGGGNDEGGGYAVDAPLPKLQRSESPVLLRKRSRTIRGLEHPRPSLSSAGGHADADGEHSFLSRVAFTPGAGTGRGAGRGGGFGRAPTTAQPVARSISEPGRTSSFNASEPPVTVEPALPTVPHDKHPDLHVITHATLAKLLDGAYDDRLSGHTILDCRFKFEHDGGHIRGAKLLNDPCLTADYLMREPLLGCQTHALIFHCEFSQNRAPSMLRHIRNLDRKLHAASYPELHYPQMFLLEGGYKKFFHEEPACCEPCAYCPMARKEHEDECRRSFKDLRASMRKSKEAGLRGIARNPLRNSAPS